MIRGGNIYILTNAAKTVLYIGVTSDLRSRITEHREKKHHNSFTSKYNLTICIYYENFFDIEEAINREKQLKRWSRNKKELLINAVNPEWKDLWQEIKEW